jgi:hypothetical protein
LLAWVRAPRRLSPTCPETCCRRPVSHRLGPSPTGSEARFRCPETRSRCLEEACPCYPEEVHRCRLEEAYPGRLEGAYPCRSVARLCHSEAHPYRLEEVRPCRLEEAHPCRLEARPYRLKEAHPCRLEVRPYRLEEARPCRLEEAHPCHLVASSLGRGMLAGDLTCQRLAWHRVQSDHPYPGHHRLKQPSLQPRGEHQATRRASG